eukprot:6201586-Pleurochrysis_carterae.AAC.1
MYDACCLMRTERACGARAGAHSRLHQEDVQDEVPHGGCVAAAADDAVERADGDGRPSSHAPSLRMHTLAFACTRSPSHAHARAHVPM